VEIEIGDDHLSGTETAAVDDVVGIHVDETRLRAGDNQTGIVEREAAGAETIAVQDRANLVAISECESGRAIPRLNDVAAVLKERGGVAGIGWRYDHAHGFADCTAAVG
jgi:hypothetical protein